MWAPPPAVDLPWLHGSEIMEEPKIRIDPSTCRGPSLVSWLGDKGGGTQTVFLGEKEVILGPVEIQPSVAQTELGLEDLSSPGAV